MSWKNRSKAVSRQCALPLLILALLSGLTTVARAEVRDPMEHFFSQSFGDLKEEATTAKSAGKKAILIMFDNAECPWCRKMKATILNQSEVQDYYRKNFHIIAIDTEGSNPIIDFNGKEWLERDYTLKYNRVRATPVFLFVDFTGKTLMRYTGAVRNIEEFMWLGEFVAEGHYTTQKFVSYKRKRRAESRK